MEILTDQDPQDPSATQPETTQERWWRWKYEKATTKIVAQRDALRVLNGQYEDCQNQILAQDKQLNERAKIISHLGKVLRERKQANSQLQLDYEALITWNKHQAAAIRSLQQDKTDLDSLVALLDKLVIKCDEENRRLRLHEVEYEKKIIALEYKLEEALTSDSSDFLEHP